MVWAVWFGRLPPAEFTFTNGDEIKTVDPAIVTGAPEGRIIRALFEGLWAWDPKTLRPVPGVARSWDVSEDKLTYTFHLRHDALWADGSRVTAEDFAWAFRRFLHPATAAEYAYEMWYVVGAERYTTGRVEPGAPVEIELLEKLPNALPFASGIIVRGTLVALQPKKGPGLICAKHPPGRSGKLNLVPFSAREKIHVVEIDGRQRRFQKGATAKETEDYRWLLYDFRSVGIRAIDGRTLEIRLKHPVPYFVNLMGFYPMFPVNRRCVQTHGYPAWTKPAVIVTNGPYRLKFRRIRDRIRLVKSPTYWDRDNVHLKVIDALAVTSYATMLNMYMTGQADWITTVPTEIVPDLLARKQGDFKPAPFLGTYYYLLNTAKPPLGDVRVRRALGLAIDKREIVERITRAGQIPARSLVPAEISNYIDYTPAKCGAYNVEAARRLLAEAGYPGGRGLPKIEILYNTSEAHQAVAELIQSQWKRALGINVRLRNQEWTAYLSSRRQLHYQIARAAWIGDYIDPNTFLDMFVTGGANNQTGWGDSRYDRLVEQAQQEPDTTKRMEYFHRAEQILMDQMPIIPIYFYVTTSMVRPYVKGFYPNIQDVHPLKALRIDRKRKDEGGRQKSDRAACGFAAKSFSPGGHAGTLPSPRGHGKNTLWNSPP